MSDPKTIGELDDLSPGQTDDLVEIERGTEFPASGKVPLGNAAFRDAADAAEVSAKAADRVVPAEHLFSPLSPMALSIVANEVAINLALGRKFKLAFDDDFELQMPTNVEEGDEFIIHFTADGGGDTPSFAAGYLGADDELPEINAGDTERTRLHFEVTAESAGVATEVLVTPAGGLWGDGS